MRSTEQSSEGAENDVVEPGDRDARHSTSTEGAKLESPGCRPGDRVTPEREEGPTGRDPIDRDLAGTFSNRVTARWAFALDDRTANYTLPVLQRRTIRPLVWNSSLSGPWFHSK